MKMAFHLLLSPVGLPLCTPLHILCPSVCTRATAVICSYRFILLFVLIVSYIPLPHCFRSLHTPFYHRSLTHSLSPYLTGFPSVSLSLSLSLILSLSLALSLSLSRSVSLSLSLSRALSLSLCLALSLSLSLSRPPARLLLPQQQISCWPRLQAAGAGLSGPGIDPAPS